MMEAILSEDHWESGGEEEDEEEGSEVRKRSA